MTPLTVGRAVTDWKFDPVVLTVALLLAGGYGFGLVRVRHPGGRWPRSRSVAFTAGLVLFVVATESFVNAYSPVLFWARSLQNVLLLLMPVPLLLACGAPLTLVTLAAPRIGR